MKYVLELATALYRSECSDPGLDLLVLQLVHQACHVAAAAKHLVIDGGAVAWLTNIVIEESRAAAAAGTPTALKGASGATLGIPAAGEAGARPGGDAKRHAVSQAADVSAESSWAVSSAAGGASEAAGFFSPCARLAALCLQQLIASKAGLMRLKGKNSSYKSTVASYSLAVAQLSTLADSWSAAAARQRTAGASNLQHAAESTRLLARQLDGLLHSAVYKSSKHLPLS